MGYIIFSIDAATERVLREANTPVAMAYNGQSVYLREEIKDLRIQETLAYYGSGGLWHEPRLIYRAKNMIIDLKNYVVTVDGVRKYGSRIEFSLLELFLNNPHQTLERGTIADRLYFFNQPVLDNTISANISRVRKLIGDVNKEIILTHSSIGYSWELDVEIVKDPENV